MNRSELARRTADYIEQNPGLYKFSRTRVPDCGSPGCVIGLAAMLVHIERGARVHAICEKLFGVDYDTLYDLLHDANMSFRNDLSYSICSKAAANALRKVADDWEAEALPDWNAIAHQPYAEVA